MIIRKMKKKNNRLSVEADEFGGTDDLESTVFEGLVPGRELDRRI